MKSASLAHSRVPPLLPLARLPVPPPTPLILARAPSLLPRLLLRTLLHHTHPLRPQPHPLLLASRKVGPLPGTVFRILSLARAEASEEA